MKRNLFIITGIFLVLLALMVMGNIIIVGEKIGSVTHLWWTEYIFYGIISVLALYFILLPFIHIHRTPQFPIMSLQDDVSMEQLREVGFTLANHCDYISNENIRDNNNHVSNIRRQHQEMLRQQITAAVNNTDRLREIVQDEMNRRFQGDAHLGVLGINSRIREWAKSVFMITAISQNSRFDAASVMYLNVKMIADIVRASGFRPTNRQLVRMYCSILTTALITYAASEALTISGSVSPFEWGDVDGADEALSDNVADIDSETLDAADWAGNADGFSLYSVLRRIKIPGIVVSAAIDGTLNALMTLRIGYITRAYLQKGAQALDGVQNKRAIKRQAMADAFLNIPPVIAAGSGVIGKRTSQFLIRLIRKDDSKSSYLKILREKISKFF